MSFLLLS